MSPISWTKQLYVKALSWSQNGLVIFLKWRRCWYREAVVRWPMIPCPAMLIELGGSASRCMLGLFRSITVTACFHVFPYHNFELVWWYIDDERCHFYCSRPCPSSTTLDKISQPRPRNLRSWTSWKAWTILTLSLWQALHAITCHIVQHCYRMLPSYLVFSRCIYFVLLVSIVSSRQIVVYFDELWT